MNYAEFGEFAPENKRTPEQKLWVAVLAQAFHDASATLPRMSYKEHFSIQSKSLIKRQRAVILDARKFLSSPKNKWRQTICDFLDLNEEYVVSCAKNIIRKRIGIIGAW